MDAIERIERYVQGVKQEEFEVKDLLQDAVIRQLEIIGEASNRISADLKAMYSDVPWRDIVDMRNKLIHHYFGVDMGLVWMTVKRDVPALKQVVCDMLSDMGEESLC